MQIIMETRHSHTAQNQVIWSENEQRLNSDSHINVTPAHGSRRTVRIALKIRFIEIENSFHSSKCGAQNTFIFMCELANSSALKNEVKLKMWMEFNVAFMC